MTLQEQVALFHWRQSLTERAAVGVFHRLRRGAGWLTEPERAVLERFCDEETEHGNALRTLARRVLPLRPVKVTPVMYEPARRPDHVALALVTFGERFAMRGLRFMAAFSAGTLGDEEAGRLYTRLVVEEIPHISWGRAVLARLRREDPARAQDMMGVLRDRMISTGYRTTRADRAWMAPGRALRQGPAPTCPC